MYNLQTLLVLCFDKKRFDLDKQGKHDEAIQAYDKAIQLNPDVPKPRNWVKG